MVAGFEANDQRMVPGELRGYRQFALGYEEQRFTANSRWAGYDAVVLRSTTITSLNRVSWPETKPLVAMCPYGRDALSFDEFPGSPNPKHAAPNSDCGCGIYSLRFPGIWSAYAPLTGVIANSGRTIVGTMGYRSERARIVALAFMPWVDSAASQRTLLAVAGAKRMGVGGAGERGIEVFDSLNDMHEQYPPDDLSSLFPADLVNEMKEEQEQFLAKRWHSFHNGGPSPGIQNDRVMVWGGLKVLLPSWASDVR